MIRKRIVVSPSGPDRASGPGFTLATNDDWQSDPQASKVVSNGLAPKSNLESALYLSLPPGQYTAIVSPKGSTGGVGLVEFYFDTATG